MFNPIKKLIKNSTWKSLYIPIIITCFVIVISILEKFNLYSDLLSKVNSKNFIDSIKWFHFTIETWQFISDLGTSLSAIPFIGGFLRIIVTIALLILFIIVAVTEFFLCLFLVLLCLIIFEFIPAILYYLLAYLLPVLCPIGIFALLVFSFKEKLPKINKIVYLICLIICIISLCFFVKYRVA